MYHAPWDELSVTSQITAARETKNREGVNTVGLEREESSSRWLTPSSTVEDLVLN